MTTHDSATSSHFDDELDALAELLAAEGIETDESHRIPRRDPSAPAPMSFSQELLWLLDRATPGMTAYNLPVVRRLRGPLDVAALERALSQVVARHEVLRTRFADDAGTPRQVIDAAAPVRVERVSAQGSTDDERVRDAQRLAQEIARRPFDLAGEHMFRAAVVAIAPDDHVLVLQSHHIVVDGWSLGVIYRELAAAYASALHGTAAALNEPEIQYADYAAWQRQVLAGNRLATLLEFWRAQLGDATDPLELPTDQRRSTATSFAGARESAVIPSDILAPLMKLAEESGATLYMLLLAAYASVLHRYTGKSNVLIGSGSAGRSQPELEGLVGYVNTTLVQRADFTGDPTFAELLARVRESALGAYDHQDIPLEKLVLELRSGDAQRSDAPLFEVVLTMQDTLPSALALEGTVVEPFGIDFGATKFDITLLVAQRDGELRLTAQYRSELFAPGTMVRFLGHLRQVLAAAATNPSTRISAITLLTPAEQAQLTAWNATTVSEGADTSLVALIEQQAARVAGQPAVVAPRGTETESLTWRELNARANQLAHHLRTHGVQADVPVGLLIDASADALVGLVGILKAGGAYVPLSVDAPAARITQQLEECGAAVVVTSAALASRVPERLTVVALDREADASALKRLPDVNPEVAASPDNLAYVLFTSGSTGTPKGVAVTHANAVHYARAISRVLANIPAGTADDGLAALDGWHFGLASTLAADLGNTSLLTSLLAGGTLHILGKDVTTEPARFAQYAQLHPLDVLKITPNHLLALAAGKTGTELAGVLPRRWIVLGGEALRIDTARTLLDAGGCRVLNHYGPTETTVGVCTFEVTAQSLAEVVGFGAATVPIGRPLVNTHTYVVDAFGSEQPVSMPGELLLGGAGVAKGYLHRDDLTRERFTDRAGERVYRTGDRVRRLENGAIEFIGRTDDQVKVRGYRVELAEVASVLRSHAGVADAAVRLRTDAAGNPQLVAYVVGKQSGYAVSHTDRASANTLTEFAATLLPDYMVPSTIVMLDALPLTANGKLDTAALPDVAEGGGQARVAPATETEERLAAIWSEVLKHETVGVTDNFIALGGHSLMAIRVLGKISKSFGVRLSLRTLFEAPTVRELAVLVDAEKSRTASTPGTGGIGAVSRDAHRIGRAVPPAGGSSS